LKVFLSKRALWLGFLLIFSACRTSPAPSEVGQADALDNDLRRAGASFFEEATYTRFRQALIAGREKLARERAKFGWFRDYGPVRVEFQKALRVGSDLLLRIHEYKAFQTKRQAGQAAELSARAERLKHMTEYFNENGDIRKNLAQAEIKLAQVNLLLRKEEFDSAQTELRSGEAYVRQAETALAELLRRYLDQGQLEKWKKWADETISESLTRGSVAILVNKLERKLTVYKAGVPWKCFGIGLGKFGLSNKLYSGDDATPEGRYKVVKKYQETAFYKALLIDYPNEEDRKAFALAKRNREIPGSAVIGGFIEIHGGGMDNLTKGCVGLENRDMDEVFGLAETGTPVTIVGAVSIENTILAEIRKFMKNGQ
jgi:L,D-peptidoglycan transpeptidase YkuD (ErfK/YbiS/YcfS/YnhG family)